MCNVPIVITNPMWQHYLCIHNYATRWMLQFMKSQPSHFIDVHVATVLGLYDTKICHEGDHTIVFNLTFSSLFSFLGVDDVGHPWIAEGSGAGKVRERPATTQHYHRNILYIVTNEWYWKNRTISKFTNFKNLKQNNQQITLLTGKNKVICTCLLEVPLIMVNSVSNLH